MKTKILLSLFIVMLTVIQLNAQSHNTKTPNCKYYQKSTSTNATAIEGGVIPVCTACKVLATKENEAKAAEDKRRAIAISEKKKADQIERQKTLEKEKKESEAKVKASEVFVTMPKTSSINNSISNEKTGQNSDLHNPETTNESTTTATTTAETPNNDLKLSDFGIPANTPTYSKQEVANQLGTQAGSLAGELLNNWIANQERKEAAYKRERELKEENNAKNYEEKFKAEYLPLMNKAIAGDENARMILYFTSDKKELWDYVPQRNKWFREALNNDNTDALLEKAKDILEYPEYFKKDGDSDYNFYIEKAANLGSIDAMILMAKYYDSKFYNTKTSLDTKKAIEFYKKAAENGSPIAMYYLGMIYKYGVIGCLGGEKYYKMLPRFDVILDEKVAFDWFLKSYEMFSRTDYQESTFAKSIKSNYFGLFGCVDHFYALDGCYRELSKIYKKGEIIAKDKDKAKKFENLANSLYSNRNFQKFNLEWEN